MGKVLFAFAAVSASLAARAAYAGQLYIPSESELAGWISSNGCPSCYSHYKPSDLTNLGSVQLYANGQIIIDQALTSTLLEGTFPTNSFKNINQNYINSWTATNIETPYNNAIAKISPIPTQPIGPTPPSFPTTITPQTLAAYNQAYASYQRAEAAFQPVLNAYNQARSAASLFGTAAVLGVVKVDGLTINASFAANSNTLVVSIPALTQFGPSGFQEAFAGTTRQDALNQFGGQQLSQAEIDKIAQSVLGFWARSQPDDPLAGNPTSIQGQLIRSSLDLSGGDSTLDDSSPGSAREGGQAGQWMVGAAYGRASSFGASSDHIDGTLEYNWRILEGDRSRLQVNVPISYSNNGGTQEFQGGGLIGLETPVINGRWTLEPELGWGATAANRLQSMGHLFTATLTSRYRIDSVGRGYFIVGDMVGYTATLSTQPLGQDLNPHLTDWVLRNGVAYEYPIQTMAFGHGISVRGSVLETNYIGSPLFLQNYQEASFSIGVRSREGQLHNSYEMLRIGFGVAWGPHYNLFNTSIGFRF